MAQLIVIVLNVNTTRNHHACLTYTANRTFALIIINGGNHIQINIITLGPAARRSVNWGAKREALSMSVCRAKLCLLSTKLRLKDGQHNHTIISK